MEQTVSQNCKAEGVDLNPAKPFKAPEQSFTNRSKAVLPLWFLNITCCSIRVSTVLRNMIISRVLFALFVIKKNR